MTREEAIKRLEVVRTNALIQKANGASEYWQEEIDGTIEAIDMAIEALHREEAEEKGYCHRIIPRNVEVVVRCKDCKWYEPAHILHADGSKTYVDEDAPWVTADVGINCGGQCIHHCGLKIYCTAHSREDPDDYENIVIFRKPNEYCCFGERREP